MKTLKDIAGAKFDTKTGRWTITLALPISHNGKELTEIVMRRAKVNDLLNVQRVPNMPQADMEVQLFAALSGVPAEALGDLDEVDYRVMQAVYSDFLALRRQTFEKPASTSLATPDGADAKSD